MIYAMNNQKAEKEVAQIANQEVGGKQQIKEDNAINVLSFFNNMKNIHVIPTDKPSRLYVRNDVTPPFYSNFQGDAVNVYITNDEEIKEGDSVPWKNQIFKVDSQNAYSGTNNITLKYAKKYCKKIILTTDQDLIKDGVQAIPDDFLEWFVKNPSCEEVEIDYQTVDITEKGEWIYNYKIIIPKQTDWKDSTKALMEAYGDNPKDFPYEEPKQETLEDNTISKERLERAFLNAKKHMEKGSIAKFRASGFLEGILFASNELEEDKDFVFKNIKYLEIGWFGKKTIKTRKQTYSEFIIEKFESFLKNKKNDI